MNKTVFFYISLITLIASGSLLYFGYNNEFWFLISWAVFFGILTFLLLLYMMNGVVNHSVVLNSFLVVLSVLFSYTLFETVIHLTEAFKTPKLHARWAANSDYPVNNKAGASYSQQSEFGVQAQSGVYRAHKVAPDGSSVFNVIYKINKNRFRQTENNAPTEKAINFFGGSFTFGDALNGNETLPYLFKMLQPQYHVRNYGSQGWGVHQALAILESELDTSGVTNFLLTAPWHAERMRCTKGQSAVTNPVYKLISSDEVKRDGDCRWVESTASPVAPIKIIRIFYKSEIGKALALLLRPKKLQDNEIQIYLAMINHISKLSKQRKQNFIVGFIKASESYFYGAWTNDKVLNKLAEYDINVIDMTLAGKIEKLDKKYIVHQEYEGHPSALANLERAYLLSSFVNVNEME